MKGFRQAIFSNGLVPNLQHLFLLILCGLQTYFRHTRRWKFNFLPREPRILLTSIHEKRGRNGELEKTSKGKNGLSSIHLLAQKQNLPALKKAPYLDFIHVQNIQYIGLGFMNGSKLNKKK